MTLAHLHTSRATVPAQSNVIEGPQQQTGGDREWYYNVEQADKVQRNGPVSFQQVCGEFLPNLFLKTVFVLIGSVFPSSKIFTSLARSTIRRKPGLTVWKAGAQWVALRSSRGR